MPRFYSGRKFLEPLGLRDKSRVTVPDLTFSTCINLNSRVSLRFSELTLTVTPPDIALCPVIIVGEVVGRKYSARRLR
jgi:hypothetical protein